MAEVPLAAQLRSHVHGRADVLGRVEIKDGRKAPHHQSQLHATVPEFQNLCPRQLLRSIKLTPGKVQLEEGQL